MREAFLGLVDPAASSETGILTEAGERKGESQEGGTKEEEKEGGFGRARESEKDIRGEEERSLNLLRQKKKNKNKKHNVRNRATSLTKLR